MYTLYSQKATKYSCYSAIYIHQNDEHGKHKGFLTYCHMGCGFPWVIFCLCVYTTHSNAALTDFIR